MPGSRLQVGLTGGIGAGKSSVSGMLADLGAVVVDSDLIARDVVEPGTPGLAAVVAAFGADVLDSDGRLDRPRLGAKVFADDAARGILNGIVHPLVRGRSAELVAAAPADAVVVHDIPLLVENGLAPGFALVVVVRADPAVRLERLLASRSMSSADVQARMDAQTDDVARAVVADVVLDNSGPPDAVAAAVRELWEGRLRPYASNLHDGRAATSPAPASRPGEGTRTAARVRLALADRAEISTSSGGDTVIVRPQEAGVVLPLLAAIGWYADPARNNGSSSGALPLRSADPGAGVRLELGEPQP